MKNSSLNFAPTRDVTEKNNGHVTRIHRRDLRNFLVSQKGLRSKFGSRKTLCWGLGQHRVAAVTADRTTRHVLNYPAMPKNVLAQQEVIQSHAFELKLAERDASMDRKQGRHLLSK